MRFKLSFLLLIVTVIALILGYQTHQVHTMRSGIAKVRELGGQVYLSYECDVDGSPRGPFLPPGEKACWRSWSAGVLNSDYFTSVYCVSLSHAEISNGDLAALDSFPSLRRLYLNEMSVDDAGLIHLARRKKLRFVDLTSTHVTQAGIDKLSQIRPGIVISSDIEYQLFKALLDREFPDSSETATDGGLPETSLFMDP